jgi:hypothetical protein
MKLLSALVVAGFMLFAVSLQAEAIDILCTNSPGDVDCAGTLTWDNTAKSLTVSLENTGTDGVIEAIALNYPGTSPTPDVELTSGPTGWTLGLDGMNDFEFGADCTGTCDGIAPGETGTWVWTFDTTDNLTSADFVADANKQPGNCNVVSGSPVGAWGCIHVQQVTSVPGEGSVFVQLAAAGGPSVPEPTTMLLLGTGLLGLGIMGRRAGRK